jgi:hypothetical protein
MTEPKKLLLNEETIKEATGFSRPDLERWIRSRFAGDDTFFIDPMKEEFPGDKIAWIYRNHTGRDFFRKDVEEVAEKLLRESIKAKEQNPDRAYQVLDMIEKGSFEKPCTLIRNLAESGKYTDRQTVYGNLHEKLLLTLISMRAFLEKEFWQKQMSDYRFASTAFMGLYHLLKPEYEAMIPDFKKLIALKLKHPEAVKIKFILFKFLKYMDKEGSDFRELIRKNFKQSSPAWDVLNKSLTALRKPLDEIPVKRRIPNSIFPNVKENCYRKYLHREFKKAA